ncbi:hypothetical protein ACS0TY_016151 [Phlomoides rotata]
MLHGIAFEIEDILDECATEVSKLKRKGGKFNMKKYLFKYKIARRIKEAVEKLDALADDRKKFHLQEIVVRQPKQVDWRRETGSILNEPDHVYGRDEEKERIVDILVKEVKDCESLSVLPIIGDGGLGKTTLAQLVYNDEKVREHFGTKLWVCVSDDFDLKAILKAIIESATRQRSDLENLDSLQHRVRQELNQKRYLLILDDVWNENQEDWVRLESILACGSIGSSVIVTTRLKKVADIVRTLQSFCLRMLSLEQCWLLFKLRAFGKENDQHPNLETIGRRIVKKCGGVPLAAKALGGLLRFKREEKEWIRVEENHVWNLPEEGNSILPVLRLSYRHLPFVLKRCFAYCAVFPKNYVFGKEELIFHWMAHGCILSNGKEDVEDLGDQIWNELVVRSFLQEFRTTGRDTYFKMHDLVHDLAQSILENKISRIEIKDSGASASNDKIRHVEWKKFPKVSTSSIAVKVSSITTIVNYSRLRSLKLIGAKMEELPTAIGKLKHLRHLDLTRSSIRTLPRTFCCLSNLEILILSYCRELKCLPRNIRHMTSLRHIFLDGCRSLSHMPYRIRELTSLKTLSMFIVGDKIGTQLDELEHLNLGGRFEIKHLERVQNHMNGKKANLVEKPNLHDLAFHWEYHYNRVDKDDEKVLDVLQPYPNLATLEIDGFRGRKLPLWVKNMKNLTEIRLSRCRNCTCLPPFGDLPLLKNLVLVCLDSLEYIVEKDDNGCQNSLGVKFPSLEFLHLSILPNLKGLLKEEQAGGEMFPNIQRLYIVLCPLLTLTSTVSSNLKNLKDVNCSPLILPSFSANLENLLSLELNFGEIDDATNIPEDTLKGLCNIKKLTFNGAKKHQRLPEHWSRDLNSVTKLRLENCEMGSLFPKGWMRHLTSLEGLHILFCTGLVDFTEEFNNLHFLKRLTLQYLEDPVSLPQSFQHISSLQSLLLNRLPLLTSLPDWLVNLASLTHLAISHCPKIESLPSSIQGMTNLRSLSISECPELERRCQKPNGEDWPKIAHIPRLSIY